MPLSITHLHLGDPEQQLGWSRRNTKRANASQIKRHFIQMFQENLQEAVQHGTGSRVAPNSHHGAWHNLIKKV